MAFSSCEGHSRSSCVEPRITLRMLPTKSMYRVALLGSAKRSTPPTYREGPLVVWGRVLLHLWHNNTYHQLMYACEGGGGDWSIVDCICNVVTSTPSGGYSTPSYTLTLNRDVLVNPIFTTHCIKGLIQARLGLN